MKKGNLNKKRISIISIFIVAISIIITTIIIITSMNSNHKENYIEPKYYNINYVLDGGINDKNNLSKVVSGSTVSLFKPEKDGYIFDSWYLDNNFTQKITELKEIEQDVTIYAKFAKKYYINYHLEDAYISDNPNYYTYLDGKVILNNPVKDGYTFAGWFLDAEYTERIYEIYNLSSDINLYGKFVSGDFDYREVENGYEIIEYFGKKSIVELPNEYNNKPIVGIGFRAFFEKDFIEKVIFNSNLRYISNEAFSNCQNIECDFTNTKELETIGVSAFYCGIKNDIDKVEYIYLPKSVKIIGDNAFASVNKRIVLTSIKDFSELNTIYYKYDVIGESKDCIYFELNSKKTLLLYKDKDKNKVKLDDSFNKIAGYAFYSTFVEELQFNSSEIILDNYSLLNKTNRSLLIGNKIIFNGDYQYKNENIIVYANEVNDLVYCKKLYSKSNYEIILEDSCAFCVEKESSNNISLIFAFRKLDKNAHFIYTCNRNINKIGAYAFSKIGDININLVNTNLVEIEDYVFSDSNIIDIILPTTIRRVSKNAFDDINFMHERDGNKYMNVAHDLYGLLFEANNNFIDATIVNENAMNRLPSSITISHKVKYISENAFKNYFGMVLFENCEGLLYIGDYAFENALISDFTVSNKIEHLGNNAINISSKTNLTIENTDNNIDINTSFKCTEPGNKLITNKISKEFIDKIKFVNIILHNQEIIEKDSFRDDKVILTFESDSLKTIGDYAFANTNLKSIIVTNVELIGIGALKNTKITEFNLGKVTEIKDETFAKCKLLNTINTNNITYIGNNAFSDTKISDIDLNKVRHIGNYAFANTNITSVDLSNVVSLGYGIFEGTNKLNSMTLSFIGENSSSNKTIWYLLGEKNVYTKYEFDNIIFVNDIDLIDYTLANLALIRNLEFKGLVNILGKHVFYNTKIDNLLVNNLESIISLDFETGETSIIGDIKVNNVCITELVVPEGVSKIGNGLFKNNNNLKSVTLSSTVIEISNYAFYNCVNLETISLNKKLKMIGEKAFSNTALNSFTINSSLEKIGKDAFLGCNNLNNIHLENIEEYNKIILENSGASPFNQGAYLYIKDALIKKLVLNNINLVRSYHFYGLLGVKEIVLGETVTEIGDYTFAMMNDLERISVPKVRTYGAGAFYSDDNIKTVLIEEIDNWFTNKFINYYSNPLYYADNLSTISNPDICISNINVPDNITEINDLLFVNYNGLRIINFHKNIKKIGAGAFYSCKNLSSFNNMPKSVEVNNYAFSGCTSLKNEIMISNSKMIGKYAFLNCINIPNINLENVDLIDYSAFEGCLNVVKISVDKSNLLNDNAFKNCINCLEIDFNNVNNYGKNIIGNSNSLSKLTTSRYLNENEAYNDKYALLFTNDVYTELSDVVSPTLKEINITSGTIIIDSLFDNCQYIEKINITDTFKQIGFNAFRNCISLVDFIVPISITNIKDGAFENCKKLDRIDLSSNNIIKISDRVFKNNMLLKDVLLPETLQIIGEEAFYGCSNLSTLNSTESITTVENRAFYNCSNLKFLSLTTSCIKIGDQAFYNCSNFDNYGDISNINYLGFGAFYNTRIKTIVIPSNINILEPDTFAKCTYLESVILHEGISYIYDRCFSNCVSLTSIALKSNIHVGDEVFSNCSNLKEINSNKILNISVGLFKNCTNLRSLELNDSVQSIDNDAFYNCGKLTLKIPNTVKTIGNNAFYNCYNLTTILSNNIKYIGDYAFYNVRNLEQTIIMPKNLEYIGEYAFSGNNFVDITFNDKIHTISRHAFNNSFNLVNVILSDSLNKLGNYAFNNCPNLQLYIEQNVKYLSTPTNKTFAVIGAIDSLESIVVSNSVKFIQQDAFKNVSAKILTIPFIGNNKQSVENANYLFSNYNYQKIKSILVTEQENFSSYCFENSKFEEITLSMATTIDYHCFRNCANLKKIVIPNIKYHDNTIIYNCAKLEYIECGNTTNYTMFSNFFGGAFYIPSSLKTCVFTGENLTNDYFKGAQSLENIYVTNNIKSIDNNVFRDTKYKPTLYNNVEYIATLDDPQHVIFKFHKEYGNSIILNKKCVIASGAFNELADINIEFGTDYDIIPRNMFYNNHNIKSVKLSDTIEIIEEYAFYGCTNLSSINLNNVKIIKNYAFANCHKLEGIELTSLNTLGEHSFSHCSSLKTIKADLLEEIPSYAFYENLSLINVDIKNVKIVRNFSFYKCKMLRELDVKYLVELGPNAFGKCENLENINTNSVHIISEKAFLNCISLSNINVENLEVVGDFAFENTRLQNIKLANNVTLGIGVFKDCITLEFAEVPYLTTQIFSGCLHLENVNVYNLEVIEESSFYNCFILDLDITNVKKIKNNAFYGSGITSIDLTKVDEIGNNSFQNSKLKTVITDKLLDGIFKDCHELENVQLVDGLEAINAETFLNCMKLKEIYIPEGVKYIYTNAFLNCTSLIKIRIPNSILEIHEAGFETCKNIQFNKRSKTDLNKYLGNDENPYIVCYENNYLNILDDVKILLKGTITIACNEYRVIPKSVIFLDKDAIRCELQFGLVHNPIIYYMGSKEEWDNIRKLSQTESCVAYSIQYRFLNT